MKHSIAGTFLVFAIACPIRASLVTSSAWAACQPTGTASAPLIGSADIKAIDRAVMFLPAVGTRQVTLNVGSVLPRKIETKPVPPAVARVLPQYAGYKAFRSGMSLVIVDPRTRRLSYLLPLRHASGSPELPSGNCRK